MSTRPIALVAASYQTPPCVSGRFAPGYSKTDIRRVDIALSMRDAPHVWTVDRDFVIAVQH